MKVKFKNGSEISTIENSGDSIRSKGRMFLCGDFTHGKKKTCKQCKHFWLWGISTGRCGKTKKDTSTWNHCKYYKRDSYMFTKDGIIKRPKEYEERMM